MFTARNRSFNVGHFVYFVPSVVKTTLREGIFKQEHDTTPCMGKVEEARLGIVSFAPHMSEHVSDRGSEKARMSHSQSPIVSCVFASPERKDFGNFLNRQRRNKIKTSFFTIVLKSFIVRVR